MLILNRKLARAILVNGKIKIVVLGYKGNQVRLGIEAPKDVGVYREEVFLKIKKQKNNLDNENVVA